MNEIVKSGELKQYVQDNSGIIYKVLSGHLLKMSPWKENEDRRITEYDDSNYTMITYKNACMIVNKQFNNTVEEWTRHGKHYIANSLNENNNLAVHSCMINALPNHKVLIKNAKQMLNYVNNISIASDDGMQELKLIRHKGKIYYILIVNEFLPRVQAYNLFGEFAQWCGIGDCKPIFCETDNRFI